ncbi:MAG: CHRD domain-containing protein [Hyphomonadaceae bacterium]
MIKAHWIAAVALAGALAAGCGESTTETPATEATTETAATTPEPAVTEAAPAAEMQTLAATLGPSEGVTSDGTGTASFTFTPETGALDYTITYEGLTGPAVAAHIHGPAEPGENAPPVVPFADPASPITGTATLTPEQATELLAGKYYVNVHTAANPGGEIRGQIMVAP